MTLDDYVHVDTWSQRQNNEQAIFEGLVNALVNLRELVCWSGYAQSNPFQSYP